MTIEELKPDGKNLDKSLIGKKCQSIFCAKIVYGTIVDIWEDEDEISIKVVYDSSVEYLCDECGFYKGKQGRMNCKNRMLVNNPNFLTERITTLDLRKPRHQNVNGEWVHSGKGIYFLKLI